MFLFNGGQFELFGMLKMGQEDILELLKRNPNQVWTGSMLRKHLGKFDYHIYAQLKKLRDHGFVNYAKRIVNYREVWVYWHKK